MGRSYFSMGFRSDPFMGATPGMVVGPLTIMMTREEIEAAGYKPLRDLKLPKGYVGSYPFVVKVANNSGEYLVYADGSAMWTDYGSGRVSAPFMIR